MNNQAQIFSPSGQALSLPSNAEKYSLRHCILPLRSRQKVEGNWEETTKPVRMASPVHFCCPHCKSVSWVKIERFRQVQGLLQEESALRQSRASERSKSASDEPLKVLPYDVTIPRAAPTIVSKQPRRKSTRDHLKSFIFGFSKNGSSGKHNRPRKEQPVKQPTRPLRPPLDLCPPVSGFATTPFAREASRGSAHSPVHISSYNAAGTLLLGEASKHISPDRHEHRLSPACVPSGSIAIEPSSLAFTASHPNINDQLEYIASYSVQDAKRSPSLDFVDLDSTGPLDIIPEHDISCSTLSNTASKAALRPSPLKPHRSQPAKHIPLISDTSWSRVEPTSQSIKSNIAEKDEEEAELTHSSHMSATSSYTTESVYSDKSTASADFQSETPPSSPVVTPQRNQSRLDKARCQAESYRDDLGILDDVYELFDDGEKRWKHTANVFTEAQSESPCFQHNCESSQVHGKATEQSHLEQIGEYNTSETSSFDVRPARAKAARALLGIASRSQSSHADFEEWLFSRSKNNASHTDYEADEMKVSEQSRGSSPTTIEDFHQPNASIFHTCTEDSRQVASLSPREDASEATVDRDPREVCQTLDHSAFPPSEASTANHAGSQLSCGGIRNRLLDASRNGRTYEKGHRKEQEHSRTNSESGLNLPNILSSECERSPQNLERIEIVWKGKQYPVLIDNRGRLWEAPCPDVDCRAHGHEVQVTPHDVF